MLCESVPILVFLHMEDAVELYRPVFRYHTRRAIEIQIATRVYGHILQHNAIYNVLLLKYCYNMHSLL